MRVTCATSIGASSGCSLLTDRAAHSDEHSRSHPHEQVTSHVGFAALVISVSCASRAGAAASRKPNSVPGALSGSLRVSLLPRPADGVLFSGRVE